MFCSNCGAKASGNFCHTCGAKLQQQAIPEVQAELVHMVGGGKLPPGAPPPPPPPPPPEATLAVPPQTIRWEEEIRFDVLTKVPHIRETISRIMASTTPGFSANDFMALCDMVYRPMGPISMNRMAPMLQNFYTKMGVKTGKELKQSFTQPCGVVLFKLLCSLASHRNAIKNVHQLPDRCVIQAVIPSSMWTMEGKLVITVQKTPPGTLVEASTLVGGQFYDWGVSKKLLKEIFAELGA